MCWTKLWFFFSLIFSLSPCKMALKRHKLEFPHCGEDNMQLVLDFTMHSEREEDELRGRIRWQKGKKNLRKRDVGWAERASSHTAHLKASATLAATLGSRRPVGSPLREVTFAPLTARRDDKSSGHTSSAEFCFGRRCATCHRRPKEWEES